MPRWSLIAAQTQGGGDTRADWRYNIHSTDPPVVKETAMEGNTGETQGGQRSVLGTTDPRTPTQGSALASITRLLVGAALIGVDELTRQLPEWERKATQDTARGEQSSGLEAAGQQAPSVSGAPSLGDTSSALLGLVFQSEDLLRRGGATLGRIERATWKLAAPIHKPLRTWRLFGPMRRQYDRLAERGETQVDRWAQLGRTEARYSRTFTESAIQGTFDRSMDELSQAPQIQDLVTQQTTSMAGEMINEVRARSVSADTLTEGIVRRLLRRPSREFRLERLQIIEPANKNRKTRT